MSTSTPSRALPRHRVRVPRLLEPLLGLAGHLRCHRRLAAQVVAVETVAGLAGTATAVLSVRAAAAVALGDARAADEVLALGLAVLVGAVFSGADMWLSHLLAYRVIDTLRIQVHSAMRRLAPLGLGRRRPGDVAAAAMADAEALEWFYAHTMCQWVACAVVALATSAATVAWLGWPGLAVVAGQLVLLAVPAATASVAGRQGQVLRQRVAELSTTSIEARHSAREMVLLGLLPAHQAAVRRGTGAIQTARRAIAVRIAAEQAVTELVPVAVTIAVLVSAAARVRPGGLTAADLPAVTALAGSALAPAILAGGAMQRLGEMAAAAARIREVTTAPAAVRVPDRPQALPQRDRRGGRIEVSGLVVRYPGTTRDVLRELSLVIEPGEHLALVGASGAGKSTLVATLARLVDPVAGRVLLDGIDIAECRPPEVRQRVHLVEQRPYVFRATVRDNLDLAGRGTDDDALWQALADVGLEEHVRSLPDALDSIVAEDGQSWSGGQRQRLGIARGLLADPDVLVLDEPTASVDPITEAQLMGRLHQRRRGRTTVIVSHRPSTIATCSRVCFLEDGRLTATGTHAELARPGTRYAQVLASEQPTPHVTAPGADGAGDLSSPAERGR